MTKCNNCGANLALNAMKCCYCGGVTPGAFTSQHRNNPNQQNTHHVRPTHAVPTNNFGSHFNNNNNTSQNNAWQQNVNRPIQVDPNTVRRVRRKTQMLSLVFSAIGVIIFLVIFFPVLCTMCDFFTGIYIDEDGGGGNNSGGGVVPPQGNHLLTAGTHRVGFGSGFDLEPGEYLLIQQGGTSAYFQATLTANASVTDRVNFLFNQNFPNRHFIRVEQGWFIQFSRANLYRIENAPQINQFASQWSEGQYLVGQCIRPGQYRLEQAGSSRGYFALTWTPNAGPTDRTNFITNRNFDGQSFVDLEIGMYIYFSRSTLTRLGDLP